MEVLTKPTSSSAAAGASSSPLYNAQCFAMLLWAHGPHNGKYHLHHYDHYVGHWPTFNVMGQGFLANLYPRLIDRFEDRSNIQKIREFRSKLAGSFKSPRSQCRKMTHVKYGNFHGSSQIIVPKALISQISHASFSDIELREIKGYQAIIRELPRKFPDFTCVIFRH